jgi:hypothetical protein
VVGWRLAKTKKFRDPIVITAASSAWPASSGGVLVSRFWFHVHDDYTPGG